MAWPNYNPDNGAQISQKVAKWQTSTCLAALFSSLKGRLLAGLRALLSYRGSSQETSRLGSTVLGQPGKTSFLGDHAVVPTCGKAWLTRADQEVFSPSPSKWSAERRWATAAARGEACLGRSEATGHQFQLDSDTRPRAHYSYAVTLPKLTFQGSGK